MDELDLLARIVVNPQIYQGKPIIRGRRMAVEHILNMMAAGDSVDDLLDAYDWLEREDIQACLLYACRVLGDERVEPTIVSEVAPATTPA